MLGISLVRGAPIACALAVALIASMASTASGQAPDGGRITGTVRDSSGAVLPGTRITLTTDNTSRTVGSNTEGDFAFDGVAPGAVHTIQAQLPGFTTVTREGLVVLPGETMTVALSLKIGCVRPGPPLYGMSGPIDSLLDAEFVAHVRIAEDSYEAQIGTDGDCPRYTYHTSATILQVVTSSRRAWRPGTTIDLYSDGGLAASSEYVAFLSYDDIAGRFKLGEPFIAIPVVSGRVEWGWEGAFGFPDRAPLGRARGDSRDVRPTHPLPAPWQGRSRSAT